MPGDYIIWYIYYTLNTVTSLFNLLFSLMLFIHTISYKIMYTYNIHWSTYWMETEQQRYTDRINNLLQLEFREELGLLWHE